MKRSLALLCGALAVLAGLLPFQTKSVSALASEPVGSLAIVEAKTFLDQYRSFSGAQSPDFYDLYSDRAVIHARMQGQDKGVAFQGRAYKQWGRNLLQNGRAALDGSVFRDATVEQRGARLVIHAKRYSTTRCYWDPNYLVGIEKEGASYRIVEERLGTNPAGRCSATSSAVLAPTTAPTSFPLGSGYAGLSSANNPAMISSVGVPSVSASSEFHPMSQQEIADTAMRMAQQIAAQYQPKTPATASATLSSAAGVAMPSTQSAVRPAGAPPPTGPPSALWVTPQD
jgi:hypothetical protein